MGIGDTISSGMQDGEERGESRSIAAGSSISAQSIRAVSLASRTLFDLIFPPLCLGCSARLVSHDALCPACWRQIDFIRPPLCDRLGVPLPYDTGGVMISAAAAADPPPFERARIVARYGGLMRKMIHDFKFKDSQHARQLFGRWLAETGRELIADAGVIVAVPLATPRLIWRRFNQAQVLAREVSRRSGVPDAPLALARTRRTRSQIGLSRGERMRNVAGAFRVRPGREAEIAGKNVLLIDDIITTGATARAATRALLKAGASRVDIIALALAGDVPHIP